ncbi:ankyrin repeat domain-containing protein [Pulveribacter sp.]|uniref:ankyrin repeat domain-containing protein n=1 Tax=Pulveribacter sp. TaxID=2678893 RepID=UPI0028AAE4E1|nr:ankyrin repeat domain-containing protein [Pulveribacter sp.]
MAGAGGDWKDFYAAAERGDLHCVRYHLRNGVDVDYQHPEVMQSALFISVLHRHEAVARALLEHGADPNLPAELGSVTPLQAARQARSEALQALLVAFGARTSRPATRNPWWLRWLPQV